MRDFRSIDNGQWTIDNGQLTVDSWGYFGVRYESGIRIT